MYVHALYMLVSLMECVIVIFALYIMQLFIIESHFSFVYQILCLL